MNVRVPSCHLGSCDLVSRSRSTFQLVRPVKSEPASRCRRVPQQRGCHPPLGRAEANGPFYGIALGSPLAVVLAQVRVVAEQACPNQLGQDRSLVKFDGLAVATDLALGLITHAGY